MSESTASLVDALGMDEEEQALADAFYTAMLDMSRGSERSQQAAEFKVGVSDLGWCSEQTRRMLLGQVPDEMDELLAWIGTALGDHAERAFVRMYPNAISQAQVMLRLEGDQRTYNIPGHPDLILPDQGVLIDNKTKFGFGVIRREGPSQQQQFQRHGYAKAAWEGGLFADHIKLEDVKVANIWIDRSGIERGVWVQMEPYNEEHVISAGQWLDEVVYAYLETAAGRETIAKKEPAREVCYATCGFAEECRGDDTDVEGLLTDSEVLTAIAAYKEGAEAEKAGKKLKEECKDVLRNIEGSTGDDVLRWTWINPVEMAPSTRKGYYRMDLKPVKRSKKK